MLDSGNCGRKYVLWFIFQAVTFQLTTASQCYWKTGMSAEAEAEPCFPSQTDSPCCSTNKTNGDPDDICLSNGLCLIQVEPYTGLLLQNSCTDETWESGDCPKICPDSENFGIHVLPCPGISNRHWCCSGNGSDCCSDAFELNMGTVMLPSNSSSNSSSASTTSMSTTTVTADASGNAIPSSGDSEKTTTIGVGVGVGVGLSVCLVAAIFGLWFQKRLYQKKLELKVYQGQVQVQPMPAQPYPVVQYPVELPPNHKPMVHEMEASRSRP